MASSNKKAVVLHSGGMDSSICLALMIKEFGADAVLSLGFDYGQRHSQELAAAQRICAEWKVDRKVFNFAEIRLGFSNALVDASLPLQDTNTLVAGRNGLMAYVAALHAASIGAQRLVLGVIEVDAKVTGYRDCSRAYWDLHEKLLQWDLGDSDFVIATPLVAMSKRDTMAVADSLGVLPFLLQETVTCYDGQKAPGCMQCHACRLRAQGLAEYCNQG